MNATSLLLLSHRDDNRALQQDGGRAPRPKHAATRDHRQADGRQHLSLLEKHGANSFFAPPSIWIALLRSPNFDKTNLSRLSKDYYGASIMPVALLEEIGRRLPRVRLLNFYGQTEIAPLARLQTDSRACKRPGVRQINNPPGDDHVIGHPRNGFCQRSGI